MYEWRKYCVCRREINKIQKCMSMSTTRDNCNIQMLTFAIGTKYFRSNKTYMNLSLLFVGTNMYTSFSPSSLSGSCVCVAHHFPPFTSAHTFYIYVRASLFSSDIARAPLFDVQRKIERAEIDIAEALPVSSYGLNGTWQPQKLEWNDLQVSARAFKKKPRRINPVCIETRTRTFFVLLY